MKISDRIYIYIYIEEIEEFRDRSTLRERLRKQIRIRTRKSGREIQGKDIERHG